MRRDGERTVLVFVGGEAQKIEVNETPERIMDLHLGPALDAGIGVGRGTKKTRRCRRVSQFELQDSLRLRLRLQSCVRIGTRARLAGRRHGGGARRGRL